MPATVDGLKVHLGLDPASTVDGQAMQDACDAANDTARTYRPDVTESEPWPARIDRGCYLFAARLYGRRGSVQGVAAFADLGVTMLGRLDPDVRFEWELGEFQPSVIA